VYPTQPAGESFPDELARRIVMVEARNQASANFSHPESLKRQGLFDGRYKVDFDSACAKCVRCCREGAHHVDNHYHAESPTCAVNTFNDSNDQGLSYSSAQRAK
jgi:hypothetical protein